MCVEGLNLSIGSVVLLHVDGFSRFCWLLVCLRDLAARILGVLYWCHVRGK